MVFHGKSPVLIWLRHTEKSRLNLQALPAGFVPFLVIRFPYAPFNDRNPK